MFPEIRAVAKVNTPPRHLYNPQTGIIGRSESAAIPWSASGTAMREHFTVVRDFIPFENQAHRFFVLERN